jgi:nucleotide-binding universal stress UspA family protein
MNETPGHTARIIVGVDTSHNAAVAADWAAREALARHEMLTVVTAVDAPMIAGSPYEPGGAREARDRQGTALLNEVGERLAAQYSGLRLETELSERDPVHALTELSSDADLLVTGTRGHGGFTGMLLGSVSQRLAAYAHCPLVVVHGEQPGEPRPEVVLGLDHDTDPAPIDFAFDTAAKLGLSVRAVRAYGPVDTQAGVLIADVNTGRREAEFALDGQLGPARERYPHVPVSLEAESGNPVAVLLAAGRDAHLIVIGARRHHRHLSLRPGYTVHGLLSRSQTPVAVVPTP